LMFEDMSKAVVMAPLEFYQVNPVSRVMSRYNEDVSNVDVQLPFNVGTLLAYSFSVGCSLLTAIILTQSLALVVLGIVPLAYLYLQMSKHYLTSVRGLQLLQRANQRRMVSYFAEALSGCAVIRACGPTHVERFACEHDGRIDAYNRVMYTRVAVDQWFELRVHFLGALLVMAITICLISVPASLSPGVVGLAFNYVEIGDHWLHSLVQVWSQLEHSMLSAERIFEYIRVPNESEDDFCLTKGSEDDYSLLKDSTSCVIMEQPSTSAFPMNSNDPTEPTWTSTC